MRMVIKMLLLIMMEMMVTEIFSFLMFLEMGHDTYQAAPLTLCTPQLATASWRDDDGGDDHGDVYCSTAHHQYQHHLHRHH